MRVIITPDYATLSVAAAKVVAELVRRKPTAVLGLATGSTPLGLYRELIRLHRDEGLDFRRVRSFNLDEYALPPDDPNSYRRYMHENLFRHINCPDGQWKVPEGHARDLDAAAHEYEEQLREAGGIDLQVLGIGRAGHIGFAEPGSSLAGRTAVVALHPTTRADAAAAGHFPNLDAVPTRAVTMGVGTILESRACLILASGKAKATIWAQFLEGPVTAQVTASALHLHPNVVAICDEDAASCLHDREQYRNAERVLADQPLLPTAI